MDATGKKKILVVDDDLDTVEILKTKLENAGYQVIIGRDGKDCLNICQQDTPDLLIIDVMMPKLSGFNAVKLLKGDQAFDKVPMIILTARTQDVDRKMSKAVRADAYMTKPFNLDEIAATVKKLLEKSS